MFRSMLVRSSSSAKQSLLRRSFSSESVPERKVAILGAAKINTRSEVVGYMGDDNLAKALEGVPREPGFADAQNKTLVAQMKEEMLHMDINSMIGSSMPLGMMRIGTIIHNIEMNPGQGAKLVRAAGTNAKILKEPASGKCLLKLPSGNTRWINARCRATIGTVSNPSHGVKKLRKAGQSRWLGIRPKVRGVAMNPCDHPHGGGEGKSKSSGSRGRTSVSPWGKPCKGGYKSASVKKKKKRLAAAEAKM